MRTLFGFSCLVLVLAGCGGGATNKTDEVDTGQPAVELSEEFKKDKAAADKKYKDKTLTLSATVSGVLSKEDTGKDFAIVLLKGMQKTDPKDDGPGIECAIAGGSESKALALIRTQKVKVTGKYKKVGKDESNKFAREQIYLDDCTIDAVGPDPTVHVSAAELAKAFATDAAAAKSKYLNKVVLVEGKYLGEEVYQFLGRACLIEGHSQDGKAYNVFVLGDAGRLGNPASGDTLKFRATCDGTRNVDGNPCVVLIGPKVMK